MEPTVDALIKENLALLPIEARLNPIDAEMRASRLLIARAQLAQYKWVVINNKIKNTSLQNVVYNKLLSTATGKTVTEKGATIEATPEYITVREAAETFDNNVKYIDSVMSVFAEGHLLLRQMGKDNG